MKKILLLTLLLLLAQEGCGDPAPGSVSGVVTANKPAGSNIYVAIGESLDDMAYGEYTQLLTMNAQGSFTFKDIPPGAYRLAAFIDANGDGRPDFRVEPYFVLQQELLISPGAEIENISVKGFFNERDASFKTEERTERYRVMGVRAGTAVKRAHANLRDEKSDLFIKVMPTLRAMVHEAEMTWKLAGNESDWEHITALLKPVPEIAQGAIEGRDLTTALRGFHLRAYLSALDRSVQRYAVYVPAQYDGSRPFPLVVALHGAGGDHWSGMRTVTGFSEQLIGPEVANRRFHPQSGPPDFIIASPGGHGYDGPGYRGAGEYDVRKVILEMKTNYNVDPDRVYLTGASKGGRGVWELGLTSPDMFAAIAPVAGGTGLARNLVGNAPKVRIYAFHGAKDKIISVNESRAIAALVYQAGQRAEFEYTEYAEWGHDACYRVYEGGAIFDLFRR